MLQSIWASHTLLKSSKRPCLMVRVQRSRHIATPTDQHPVMPMYAHQSTSSIISTSGCCTVQTASTSHDPHSSGGPRYRCHRLASSWLRCSNMIRLVSSRLAALHPSLLLHSLPHQNPHCARPALDSDVQPVERKCVRHLKCNGTAGYWSSRQVRDSLERGNRSETQVARQG